MKGADQVIGNQLRRHDGPLHPEIVLQLAGGADADRAGVSAAVALDAAAQQARPASHPLALVSRQER